MTPNMNTQNDDTQYYNTQVYPIGYLTNLATPP